MPTVQDIRIDFEITQPRLLLNAVDGVNPTDYAYIVFSQWYKGDKGDPGRDGSDGHDGVDGTDGFSPTVETTTISGGTQVTITDAVGAHTFNVTNGTDGQDGTNGQDGFSPVVTVTTTADGHEVTITDAVGDHTFDVTDGHDGVGIPQTLSLVGNELSLSGGGGTVTLPDGLPSQSGNAGKFLTTNGTEASWTDVDALPDQTGQSGKFLTTNGSEASWDEVPEQVNADWEASSGPSEILHKPALGTASALDVAESGNASTTQVVKGDDTRLSDSRNAADVYPWAKAATKPSYTASEVGAIPTTDKGVANGVAELGSDGKVPSSQLPAYVDDVLEYASQSAFPATGESGKIYVALDTNKTYRWSGSTYVEISESLALGETSSTAYAGNKGKANADAIAAIKDGSTIDSFADVETALAGKQDTIDSNNKLSADLVADGNNNKVFTSAEKTKLGGIESGAQVNVKPDWNATSGSASEILNKPTIPDVTGKADKVSNPTDGNFAALDSSGNLTDSGHKHSDYLTSHQDISGKADKVSSATSGNLASLDSNGNLTDSGAKDSDYVHITGAETITGVKKFTQPVTMQNGAGPGSLIFGADVNAGTLTHNTRKLGRINSPAEDVRNGLTATLLGWDTQGNYADAMHTANRDYDTVSFGGMKKISTNTSPMNIVFCVTKKRNSKVPADKVYPIEMDANEVRFNVQPNYVGNRLLNTTDILDSTSSTATDKAATPNAVKSAYDLAAAAIPKSLGTAAGDIIYYTANGTPARLAKGTTGQVLTINSGATAPEWTDVPTELPALTNNASKILAVNSGATGVEWVTPSSGLTNYDFTHTANQSVSGSVTVTYAANTRGSQMITVSDDIAISFVVNNDSDNYLWIENSDTTNNIDVTISSVTHNGNVVSNVRMPRDGIAVPAGGTCEIGIVCNTDGAFITSRDDLE